MSSDFDLMHREPRVTVRTSVLGGKTISIFEVRVVFFRDPEKTKIAGVSRLALSRGSTWKEALEAFEEKLDGLGLRPIPVDKKDFME